MSDPEIIQTEQRNINQEGGLSLTDVPNLVQTLKTTAENFFSTVKAQTSNVRSRVSTMIGDNIPKIQGAVSNLPDEFGVIKTTIETVLSKVSDMDGMIDVVKTGLENNLKGYIDTRLLNAGLPTASPDGAVSGPPPPWVSGEAVGGSGEDQFIIDECAKKVRSMILRDLRKSGYKITKKRRNKRSRARTKGRRVRTKRRVVRTKRRR
jgi:hypothetical protein